MQGLFVVCIAFLVEVLFHDEELYVTLVVNFKHVVQPCRAANSKNE
jgi:hypothetical protein